MKRKLSDLGFARSGDKGKDVNIGVIAFDEKSYEFLKRHLTEEAVLNYFQGLKIKSVKRYLWPSIGSMNFILKDALEEGGSLSLKLDAQGKGLGQKLLQITLEGD